MPNPHEHPKLDFAMGWIKDRREKNLPDNYRLALKEGVSHTSYFAAKRILAGKPGYYTPKNLPAPIGPNGVDKGAKGRETRIKKSEERKQYVSLIRSFERAGIVELHYENGRLEVSHVAKTVVEVK